MALFSTRNGIIGSSGVTPRWFIGCDAQQSVFSDDDGTTWTVIPFATTLDRSVTYGTQNGTIMGNRFGTAYRSTDNGDNFTGVGTIFSSGSVLAYTGNIQGKWVAVGSDNQIKYSSNDGALWTTATSPFSGGPDLTGVTNNKSNRFVTCGASHNPGAGNVFTLGYSNDGGVNWVDTSVSGNTTGVSFTDIATDGTTWIAVGEESIMYRSTDGGATWVDISAGTPFGGNLGDSIFSIAHHNGTWIISGVDATLPSTQVGISYSNDSGTTWSSFISNTVGQAGENRVRAAGNGVFMVVYRDNTVFKSMVSNDLGVTWSSPSATPLSGAWGGRGNFLGNNSGNT